MVRKPTIYALFPEIQSGFIEKFHHVFHHVFKDPQLIDGIIILVVSHWSAQQAAGAKGSQSLSQMVSGSAADEIRCHKRPYSIPLPLSV